MSITPATSPRKPRHVEIQSPESTHVSKVIPDANVDSVDLPRLASAIEGLSAAIEGANVIHKEASAGLLGCMEGIRLLAHNAVIDKILIRGWANLKEASLYLGRSDTFLRRYLDQPGDGDADPTKLNGEKGQKDWTFTVAELDRFNKDFLRTSVPIVGSDGVEIRNSQVTNRRPR